MHIETYNSAVHGFSFEDGHVRRQLLRDEEEEPISLMLKDLTSCADKDEVAAYIYSRAAFFGLQNYQQVKDTILANLQDIAKATDTHLEVAKDHQGHAGLGSQPLQKLEQNNFSDDIVQEAHYA